MIKFYHSILSRCFAMPEFNGLMLFNSRGSIEFSDFDRQQNKNATTEHKYTRYFHSEYKIEREYTICIFPSLQERDLYVYSKRQTLDSFRSGKMDGNITSLRSVLFPSPVKFPLFDRDFKQTCLSGNPFEPPCRENQNCLSKLPNGSARRSPGEQRKEILAPAFLIYCSYIEEYGQRKGNAHPRKPTLCLARSSDPQESGFHGLASESVMISEIKEALR